jgi:hypothetical protein
MTSVPDSGLTHITRGPRVTGVSLRTIGRAEEDGGLDSEVGDGAGLLVDVELELLKPRLEGKGAAAGTAVGEPIQSVIAAVVEQVREETASRLKLAPTTPW